MPRTESYLSLTEQKIGFINCSVGVQFVVVVVVALHRCRCCCCCGLNNDLLSKLYRSLSDQPKLILRD